MKKTTIMLRNVPENTRAKLKSLAALEKRSMQALVLDLIEQYVVAKKGTAPVRGWEKNG